MGFDKCLIMCLWIKYKYDLNKFPQKQLQKCISPQNLKCYYFTAHTQNYTTL